jgi:hypothetical protein
MWRRGIYGAIAGFMMCAVVPANASDLADFNALMEGVASHSRVAIGYLRTENTDLASVELDRTRDAWGKLMQRFGGHRPDVFEGSRLYHNFMTGVSARLVATSLLMNAGRPDAAMDSLNRLRDDVHALRQESGIIVLADCVREANLAMDALMAYNERALDLGDAITAADLAGKAAVYGHVLHQCDAIAGPSIREEGEFRRLVDGAQASLTFIPKAIAARDVDQLHRVLGELRAFDNLLAFRFG